ncbi:hypothetical protein FsymDg_4425 [Candidatus Protofrankia datiscae]|uniref:Uncharacterized protein n=1 Tax=Candidatus Protofrankia datiscae TaxID=2716812 RepID=F8AZE0_9ACTN|nr:hypothetical protein FsymDg_4425 [Candidatus Protofrankia datiscae]
MPPARLSRWTQPWFRPWSARRIRIFWLVSRVLLVILAVAGRTLGAQHGVLGDVRLYDHWGHGLVHGAGLPVDDDRWQYPPAAAIALAVPSVLETVTRLPYEVGFFLMILAADAAVTGMLARRSASAARFWLLGICALGPVALARFDLLPAVLVVAALVGATDRRWGRVGLAVGLGVLLKVWPVLLLPAFGRVVGARGPVPGAGPAPARDARPGPLVARATGTASWPALARLAGGLAAAVALVAAVLFATGWWREAFGFLGAQEARGLQTEAVPATPFVLAHMVGLGSGPVYDWGSFQFGSPAARAVATACSVAEIVAVLGATVWWWTPLRSRAATNPADRMLALLLIVLVTSRVLSPQYLVWLLAVAACRPLWPNPAASGPASGPGLATGTAPVASPVIGPVVGPAAGRGAAIGAGCTAGAAPMAGPELAAGHTGLDSVSGTGTEPATGTGAGGPDRAGAPSRTGPDTGVGPVGARAAQPAPPRRWITVGLPAICLISLVVYPIRYDDLLAGQVVASLLLVVRNLLLVIVCWFAVGEVARAARPGRRPPQPRL